MIKLQFLYFFFDDSGTFHKNNPAQKFIYAGYVFQSKEELDTAKRKYRSLVKNIQSKLGITTEIKAFGLENKYKRALYNVLREYEILSVVVDISRVFESILNSSKSICRYNDYILKRAIKKKVRDLINQQKIYPNEEIKLHIFIDEQLTSSDGIYGLKETIKEEFQNGIRNYDYGVFHPPLFSKEVFVEVQYCNSKNNYMIQACDILANRIFSSYRDNEPKLRKIPNHFNLTLP